MQNVIIAGTTKAATTSLFNYLADHPEVCASKNKETRFFLDASYPLVPPATHISEGIDKYQEFFDYCREKSVRLEATPDYLYGERTAYNIHRYLPDVKLIFIFREPHERLESWYRFAKQNNLISKDMLFTDYVHQQLISQNDHPPQHLRALEQGRYAHYLQAYIDFFDNEQFLFLDYQEMKDEPLDCLTKVCRFIGLTTEYYTHYNFIVHNKTQLMRSASLNRRLTCLRRQVRSKVRHSYLIHKGYRNFWRLIEPFYLHLNRKIGKKGTALEIDDELAAMIERYYAADQEYLHELMAQNNCLTEGA